MSDEDLTGYLMDALDADDRVAVDAQLRTNPDAAVRLDQLRARFAPLEADRAAAPAPAGLALRTMGRLAEYLAEHEPQCCPSANLAAAVHQSLNADMPTGEPLATPGSSLPRAPREAPETRVVGGRFRPDIIVACGIALFAGGLVFSAVGKVRARNEMIACQNALRVTHGGLSGYADTHNDRYPKIGADSTADSFAVALAASGQVPANFHPVCPACLAAAETTTPSPAAGYTYTLGYRTPAGELVGLRRPSNTSDEHDLLPIAADYPSARAAPAAGPLCPHPFGMNVLYAGGNIRVTTSALIGPDGDHIFQNIYGSVGAGAGRADVVLGRPGDRP